MSVLLCKNTSESIIQNERVEIASILNFVALHESRKKKEKIYNMLIILSSFICTNDHVLYDVLYKQ